MQIIRYDQVESKIIVVRSQQVILDSDVAELYGIEVKRVNEAVRRNPDKFPEGYIINLTSNEWHEVKSQIATSPYTSQLGGGKVKLPSGFTERGLYMLATILKSPQAVETTLAIIDTFAKFKQLTQVVYQFAHATTNEQRENILIRGTDLVADLLDNDLIVSQKETGFKIKLPFFEFTRKITKVKK